MLGLLFQQNPCAGLDSVFAVQGFDVLQSVMQLPMLEILIKPEQISSTPNGVAATSPNVQMPSARNDRARRSAIPASFCTGTSKINSRSFSSGCWIKLGETGGGGGESARVISRRKYGKLSFQVYCKRS